MNINKHGHEHVYNILPITSYPILTKKCIINITRLYFIDFIVIDFNHHNSMTIKYLYADININ